MKHESHGTMPHDSEIIKEGELFKIGRKTGTMRKRYYVLRDHSLFIYNNKGQKIPSSLIFLKGMFINPMKPDPKTNNAHGFCIQHPSDLVRTRTYYHRSKEVIDEWINLLRFSSTGTYSAGFDEKYYRGPQLGQGKFSTVYQCKNKENGELTAVKQIVKAQLTEREQDFLREEIQIIRLIHHKNIV